jgi:hypothetical protein
MKSIEPSLVWEDGIMTTNPKKNSRMIFFPSLAAIRIIGRMVGK